MENVGIIGILAYPKTSDKDILKNDNIRPCLVSIVVIEGHLMY